MLYLPLILIVGLAVALGFALRHPRFGKHPEGERLARIEQSPNYSGGVFRNLEPTPSFSGKGGQVSALAEYFFAPKKRLKPASPLPVVKTDLKSLDPQKDLIVWLGHSSCYLQLGGKKILLDPLLGSHASPFFFSTQAFMGDYPYSVADMPETDYLLITHDHWDHLEYPTLLALAAGGASKAGTIICPLGVGAHLEYWGVAGERVVEGDWYDEIPAEGNVRIHLVPSRHFSGRTLTRNKTLWTGFVLESNSRRIYISGDGGYGRHFAEARARFGDFDLAIIENGQYDKNWKYVHMTPEESAQAAADLGAKAALPVHSGRFSISNHAWDDPLVRISRASEGKAYRLLTPVIGQVVYLDDETQVFPRWWEGLE